MVLGGARLIAVALMFVKPQERDFDDNWPQGWKWSDVAEAADRFYERNPGQTYGSMDGVRYNNQAWDVLSGFFASNGFSETDAIEKPNEKQNVFSHPPWNLADGLRSGPVKTYLPMVQDLSNFKLELNTKVIRAVRNGSTISGIETETSSGARVIYNLNAGGKVLLAAGTMSTPRILFNSGIGPTEQLQTVADGTSGVTLPAQSDWINLPVGAQIKDHPIFTIKFNTTANLSALATTEFTSPNDTSVDLFAQGSGILAQSGQRLNFWTSVNTTDGQEVFVQGTCTGPAENTIQMKIYLTHGLTSVGSLGITADGATELTSEPWMTTDTDIEAATTFMDRLLEMTRQSNSTLSFYSAGTATGSNVTGADLIKTYVTGAHYVGTAKMGTEGDEGVVVDTNTKVYGTDNLFVVDASMHPDLPTGNTQAIVMVAAEAAVAKILALGGSANGTDSSASSSALPLEVSASAVQSESPVETGTESTSTISSTPGQGQQTPQPGNNRPHGSHHRHSRNGNGGPQSLSTSTTTPQATPARIHARRHKKRQLVGRLPYGPEYADSDGEILERSQMERASFLDSAYAEY
jgi:cellobiose dehydrogenase (acceptor)